VYNNEVNVVVKFLINVGLISFAYFWFFENQGCWRQWFECLGLCSRSL